MTTLTSKKIRIAADAASLDAPQDALTSLTPAFFRGNDLRVEFAIFQKGVLQDVSNLTSVTLEIRPTDDDFTAPDPSVSVLMTKTINAAALNNSLIAADWNANVSQHGVIAFSATESNIAAGPMWMSLWVLTNDSPGKVITVAAGPLVVREDGSSGSVQTPPAPTANYYTTAQSDARYLQQSQNLSDLTSNSAARTNLGLGTAATLNAGTSSGNIPVLDSTGKLSSGVIPTVDTSTLQPRGGVWMNGGWIEIPALTLGKSDFDFNFLVKREAWGTEQYIMSGAFGCLAMRFSSADTVRVSVLSVGDILESSATLLTDVPTWIRLKRSGGQLQLYFGATVVGTLSDSLNYTGAINVLGAQDTSGTNAFKGILMTAACWNRGVDDGALNDFKTVGGVDLIDRWGSMTNIYNASSLTIGKRVYLKTNGSETITINGTTYGNGTGNTNATGGLEIVVASSTITNSLTSASTMRYVGQVFDLDLAVGCGYQLRDRTGNALHALLSENNTEHMLKKREWQLTTTVSGAGYLGNASARAVLPSGHILSRIYTVGGSGVTISMGESSGATTLVSSSACSSGVVNATIGSYRSSNNRAYVNYVSGTGSVEVVMTGTVE